MDQRPLSDRRHTPREAVNRFEVRVWEASEPGPAKWRTLACCAEFEDAREIARAVVHDASGPYGYSEVWGCEQRRDGRQNVMLRFPRPTRSEQLDIWQRAVERYYASGYLDLRR